MVSCEEIISNLTKEKQLSKDLKTDKNQVILKNFYFIFFLKGKLHKNIIQQYNRKEFEV